VAAIVKDLFDAYWRAAAYCLHWRVILWSLLPLVLAGSGVGLLGWAYWESAVAAVRQTLEQWSLVATALQWLEAIGATQLRTLMAPMILVALAVPAVVVLTLLLVAMLVTPAVVRMVAQRRYPELERRQGGSWWGGLLWSLACTLAALVALACSVLLWLVPPLVIVVPPLIWGWLTYRVLGYDVLALHASAAERRYVLHSRRWPLVAMGIACGYAGALPSLLWAVSAATLIFAPLLVLVTIWLYTLVFVFAACWFAHFALAELQRLRRAEAGALPPIQAIITP
jgi:hypothetical protein